MSDMRKTWLLRSFLFVVATLILWTATAVVDASALQINKSLFGEAYNKSQVEGMVFIWVTSKIIWRWLSRRVWIGTTSSSPAQSGGGS